MSMPPSRWFSMETMSVHTAGAPIRSSKSPAPFWRTGPLYLPALSLTQIHPFAESAAETAEFAGAHKRFWQMHDGLFENQFRLGLPLFVELTELLGLSTSELQTAQGPNELYDL